MTDEDRGLHIVRAPDLTRTPAEVARAVLDVQLEKRRRELDRAKRNQFISFIVWWSSLIGMAMCDLMIFDITAGRFAFVGVFLVWTIGVLGKVPRF